MTTAQSALPLRDDTFLGVCEAIGEDFGFNPIFLRIPLAVLLLWNPLAVLGGYAAAGLVVMASRLLVRNPRPASAKASADEPAATPALPTAGNEVDAEPMAAAA